MCARDGRVNVPSCLSQSIQAIHHLQVPESPAPHSAWGARVPGTCILREGVGPRQVAAQGIQLYTACPSFSCQELASCTPHMPWALYSVATFLIWIGVVDGVMSCLDLTAALLGGAALSCWLHCSLPQAASDAHCCSKGCQNQCSAC